LCLDALMRFYRLPRFLMAPNQTMIDLLRARTGKPTYFMPHGVDVARFSPARRKRTDGPFCIGYVGRLTPEKNVRLFAALEQKLRAAGHSDFRLLLIGEGSERKWLKSTLQQSDLPGVLRGDALADAFAGMDVFVFPSQTDTFGLVLLEAMASGVPVIVSPDAGARAGVTDGVSGFLAHDADGFVAAISTMLADPGLRPRMGVEARRLACSKGRSGVFESLYETYGVGLRESTKASQAL
jgi:glycosyltransferase involved in cell wall biosynthesis